MLLLTWDRKFQLNQYVYREKNLKISVPLVFELHFLYCWLIFLQLYKRKLPRPTFICLEQRSVPAMFHLQNLLSYYLHDKNIFQPSPDINSEIQTLIGRFYIFKATLPNIIRQVCEPYKFLHKKSDFQCKRGLSDDKFELRHTRISCLLLLRNFPSGRSISESRLKLSEEPCTLPKIPDHFLIRLVIPFWTEGNKQQLN